MASGTGRTSTPNERLARSGQSAPSVSGMSIGPRIAVASLVLLYVMPASLEIARIRNREVVIACFGLVALRWIAKGKIARGVTLALLVDITLLLLLLTSAVSRGSWGPALLAETSACLLIWIGGILLGTMEDFTFPIQVVRAIVFGLAVATVWSWLANQGDAASITALADNERAGLVLGPNGLGGFLAIGAAFEIFLRRDRLLHPSSILVVAFFLAAIVTTQSRGAIVSLAAGVFITALLTSKKKGRTLLLGLILVAITLAGVDALTAARVGKDQSGELRLEAWRLSLQLMGDHPIDGVGYGQAARYAVADPRLAVLLDTHNEYLRVGAEAGIPAMLLLLALVALCLLRGTRLARVAGPPATAMLAGFATYASSLVFVQGLKSFAYSAPWLLFGGLLVGTDPDRFTDPPRNRLDLESPADLQPN